MLINVTLGENEHIFWIYERTILVYGHKHMCIAMLNNFN